MKSITINRLLFWFLSLGFIANSCAVKLAPDYDVKIYDELISINGQSQKYYSEAENGLAFETYDTHKDFYNSIIGSIESLIMQLDTRPFPDSKVLNSINKRLEKEGKPIMDFQNELPSKSAMTTILKSWKKMKSDHSKGSITKGQISADKLAFDLSLKQAIQFESHLKRD